MNSFILDVHHTGQAAVTQITPVPAPTGDVTLDTSQMTWAQGRCRRR